MKKILLFILSLLLILVMCSCAEKVLSQNDIIGVWECELYGSGLVIEFTADNRFISHTDGIENKYVVEDGCIITYIEGDFENGISIEARVEGDTLLYGELEYKRFKFN